MKRIIIAALALTVSAGCTKNEVNEVKDESPISFAAIVGTLQTKAIISGTSYDEGNKFCSSAFMTSGDFDSADAAKIGTYIDNQEVTFSGTENCWSTATPYYWPKNPNLYLTFFSYHPSGIGAAITAADGVKLTDYNVSANQDDDFMVAKRITAQKNETTVNSWEAGVKTEFQHKLAQIVKFELKADKDYYHATRQPGDFEIIVKGIKINNIYTVGTYTSGKDVGTAADKLGTWSDQKTEGTETWYSDDTGKGLTTTAQEFSRSTGNNYVLVLPQDFTGHDAASITVDYILREYYTATDSVDSDLKTATGQLNQIHTDKMFNMNKKISYTITLSVDQEQIYWAPSVVDWVEESQSGTIN